MSVHMVHKTVALVYVWMLGVEVERGSVGKNDGGARAVSLDTSSFALGLPTSRG